MDCCCRDDLKNNIPEVFKKHKTLLAVLGMSWAGSDVPGPGLAVSHQLLGTLWQFLSEPPAWINPKENPKESIPADPAWQSLQLLLFSTQAGVLH